jgi:hypothetical protein
MAMKITSQIIVTLSTGENRTHEYVIDAIPAETTAWFTQHTTLLKQSMVTRSIRSFVLENPTAVYNCDHVVSVQIGFLDADQYAPMITDIEKEIPSQFGFNFPKN